MSKIVVLNSGGFDSTVLIRDLALNIEPEVDEIHSLYFSYGQLNDEQGKRCAKLNAEFVGAVHHELTIPTFSWSNNDFYNKDTNDYATQYLEMRNLIFLSFAQSLAESVGADKIYLAIMKGCTYKDTTKKFIRKMNGVSRISGVKILTPYIGYFKEDLFERAKLMNVQVTDFMSCDTPNSSGEHCGECGDCLELKNYFKNFE